MAVKLFNKQDPSVPVVVLTPAIKMNEHGQVPWGANLTSACKCKDGPEDHECDCEPESVPKSGMLQSLADLVAGKSGTLTLVNASGKVYEVVSHNSKADGKTKLKSEYGMTLNVLLTDREEKLYTPVWR